MAVSETTFDASAAELINLKKILEACIFVPDISDAGRQAGLSREQRFCYALGRFETTVRVFDQSHYESEVLHIGSKESEADEGLRKEAREGGVPDNHFPSTAKRRRIQRLSRHQAGLRPYSTFEPGIERRNTAIMLDATRFAAAQNFGPLSPLPRISISSRPSMNLAASEPRPVQDANALHSLPTPATSSVVSFKTTSSQSSWFSNKLLGKRRDSLMHFFRRDSSRASSSSGGDQVPVTPLSPGEPPASYNQNSIAEEPESASSNSHESKDFSSNQSLSISTRTSSSSFTEQPQPFQDISNLDKQKLKNFMQTKPFIQLRTSCEEEMQRFNGFAADQHVSLPLILGRNHVYNQERMKFRLAELRKEVSIHLSIVKSATAIQATITSQYSMLTASIARPRNRTDGRPARRKRTHCGRKPSRQDGRERSLECNGCQARSPKNCPARR